ncbi:N-acetylmuramoyl-L-alanine amidase [Streptococcus parauberis]|uniref:N-acetylmuramoyl-L-alanine amidase n=1 Tax=Streptococcus parauberis KRS-02083 TaxID=1207545 RepID=A0ABN0ITS0_9STRE|nr:peptidoglycan recognition family protein [Streptococcus parauberis]QBX18081.1 lysin [Streptococcus phage Javan393]EMG26233.1 prophage LambdaSa03, peptidoglycan endolysin [Streptococcus parauberis KRS-02083]WBK39091.1 endolysin [Streptococcus parauberis]WEM65830.1 peptidoglycan recognition family protein [Streptococcus parauberis]WOF47706.1 N-acetylmuramoyl-L-alanine amidase [Streptococcus parauberis]
MVAYLDFKSRVLNNGYDHDGGAFGWQCWDGFAEWCVTNGIPIINTDPVNHSGYAKDLWELRKTNGMLTYFDEVETMEGGDVAIFKEVASVTPSSHVAIFDSDIDGVYGWFLGQNQGGVPYASGGSAFNLVMLPYSATYQTAFRVKKKVEGTQNMGTKNINGDIYSNLITSSRPEIFGSWGERDIKSIKYIVLHGTYGLSVQSAVDAWTGGREASAQYIVHDNQIVGCVGENFTAWHCGGTGAITNQNSIGVEHVNNRINGENSTFSAQTIETGAKLVAEICKRLGIAPSNKTIVPHRSVFATACPQAMDVPAYIDKVKQYYNGTQKKETPKPQPKETKSVASNEQTSARLLIFDEDLNGYKKGDYLLLNFDRGTYSKVNDKAEVDFIKKQYTGIQIEHVSKAYPAHVRYIQGFKLNKI